MERPTHGIENRPSRMAVAGALGAPVGVAVVVGGALFLLLMIRGGFRGAVISYGG